MEEFTWDSGLRVHRGPACPYAEKLKNTLLMLPITILFLARSTSRITTEYLVKMRMRKEGDIIIVEDSYCVPRQRATYASVETIDDCPIEYSVAVHKHPPGMTSFSEIDYDNINQNNDVSLLIADGRVVAATIRVRQLPCGELMMIDIDPSNIVFYIPETLEKSREKARRIAEELEKKIERTVFTPVTRLPRFFY